MHYRTALARYAALKPSGTNLIKSKLRCKRKHMQMIPKGLPTKVPHLCSTQNPLSREGNKGKMSAIFQAEQKDVCRQIKLANVDLTGLKDIRD